MLSCSCDQDYEWWYVIPDDFELYDRGRRKACVSCGKMVAKGEDCVRFECYRDPYSEIEERIHGDEVALADKFMCEDCGGIFLNLSSLGYCLSLGGNVREDLADYWDLTGFKPKNGG